MAENDVLTKLPLDVIFQILAKLPTKSLLQLRCVSKYFDPLISHPHFLKTHFSTTAAHTHYLVYYESTDYTKAYFSFHARKTLSLCKNLETPFKSVNGYLRIVGSSKGVVCLFDTSYFTFVGTLILWNPFIGKFKILPSPEKISYYESNTSHSVVGFGFDYRTADYKAVMILYDCDYGGDYLPKTFVYGVKNGKWRSIEQVAPCFMLTTWSSNVFVHGVVNWLAQKWGKIHEHPNCIMGFDVVEEVFKLMELPRNLEPNLKDIRLSPSVDGTSLALFVKRHGNVGEGWAMWLMNSYGEVESWTMNHVVVLDQVFFPLRIIDGNNILASTSDEKLVSYDVEKQDFEDLDVRGLPPSFYVDDYMPSLAMLDIGDQLPW